MRDNAGPNHVNFLNQDNLGILILIQIFTFSGREIWSGSSTEESMCRWCTQNLFKYRTWKCKGKNFYSYI